MLPGALRSGWHGIARNYGATWRVDCATLSAATRTLPAMTSGISFAANILRFTSHRLRRHQCNPRHARHVLSVEQPCRLVQSDSRNKPRLHGTGHDVVPALPRGGLTDAADEVHGSSSYGVAFDRHQRAKYACADRSRGVQLLTRTSLDWTKNTKPRQRLWEVPSRKWLKFRVV
jgi:hypothetical protein